MVFLQAIEELKVWSKSSTAVVADATGVMEEVTSKYLTLLRRQQTEQGTYSIACFDGPVAAAGAVPPASNIASGAVAMEEGEDDIWEQVVKASEALATSYHEGEDLNVSTASASHVGSVIGVIEWSKAARALLMKKSWGDIGRYVCSILSLCVKTMW